MAKKKTRHHYFGRKKTSRKRSSGFGGLMSPILAGGLVGAGAALLAPQINQYVPSIAGIPPVAVALAGGGIITKALLHKDPMHLASAAIIIGVGTAAANFAGGSSGGNMGETAF
jgi:hypothetical protein